MHAALDAAGQDLGLGLSVLVTSAEHVHELNRQYAGIDSSTDVLSFPAEEEPYRVEPEMPPYIGDIAIAYPVAAEQARLYKVSVESELQRLTIHGVLHLLGYDHDSPESTSEMSRLEELAMLTASKRS